MGKIISFDGRIDFTVKPEKFSLDRSERWFLKQVAPTLKLLQEADRILGRDFVQEGLIMPN